MSDAPLSHHFQSAFDKLMDSVEAGTHEFRDALQLALEKLGADDSEEAASAALVALLQSPSLAEVLDARL